LGEADKSPFCTESIGRKQTEENQKKIQKQKTEAETKP
jgi:hypothetical protein